MAKKPNILMVAPTCGTYGGIETFTAAIAREVIDSNRFNVRVVFRLRAGCTLSDNFIKGMAQCRIPWEIMTRPGLKYLKDLIWSDLVNCHFPLVYATWPAWLLRKKLVITIENQRWPEHGDHYLRALKLADARWYIAKFVAQTWEGETLSEKSEIVPAVSDLPDEWIDPVDRKGFFFIARWVPKKGLEELVAAYAAANIDHAKNPLTLLGDGPLRGQVDALIDQSGVAQHIHSPGFVDHSEKIKQMATSRWNVAPAAFAEDLGLSPIEARACGVPSIVSDIGGLPEAGGKEALTCKPGDVDSLKTALELAASIDHASYEEKSRRCKDSLATYLPVKDFYVDAFSRILS